MKEYLNIEGLKETIREIYSDEIKKFEDEPYFKCTCYADEDLVECEINILAERLNKDMKEYLHQSDYNIIGNFNNVERDYIYHDKRGSYADFRDMIRRLDEGVDDERTNEDRDWLTAWFWETFGTFGVGYQFATAIGEELCSVEMEYTDSEN